MTQWKKVVQVRTRLTGKNTDGTWRTSRAKEYPRRLSAALAFAMVDALTEHAVRPSFCDFIQFRKQVEVYMPQLSQAQEIGADFVDSPAPIGLFLTHWLSPLSQ